MQRSVVEPGLAQPNLQEGHIGVTCSRLTLPLDRLPLGLASPKMCLSCSNPKGVQAPTCTHKLLYAPAHKQP